MIYTSKITMAMSVCYEAHHGQIDKGGAPYVFHPIHIAEQMQTEEEVVVALLHDVVEDSEYTIEWLSNIGFSKSVTDAITLLTHKKGVPYMDYIASIKSNPIAKAVKLADLRHNSDLSRLYHIDEHVLKRVEKYKKAIELLEENIDGDA